MTDEERIAKNTRIRAKGKETKLKRKEQVCRVFRLKIDLSHLNTTQATCLKRTVQHSVLGLIKSKLMKNERVVVLPKNIATTRTCPNCGKIKKNITLADRIFECECGYIEDRDIHAARNMILLSEENTCGTQGINAFGEDVRRKQKCCNADLDELGSRNFYKWR